MVPLLFMSIGYPAMWSKWLELTTEVILRGFVSRAAARKRRILGGTVVQRVYPTRDKLVRGVIHQVGQKRSRGHNGTLCVLRRRRSRLQQKSNNREGNPELNGLFFLGGFLVGTEGVELVAKS